MPGKPFKDEIEEFERDFARSERRFNRAIAWGCIGAFCLALIAIACAGPAPAPQARKVGGVPGLYTDPVTGCQYLAFNRGFTPRLGADGTPLCARPAETRP
jgi:hypothetical protein